VAPFALATSSIGSTKINIVNFSLNVGYTGSANIAVAKPKPPQSTLVLAIIYDPLSGLHELVKH
jgi:hypothetical protein